MALDESNHRLFTACRNPAQLIVFDTQTKEEICRLDIDKDADDIFWESSKKRLFISCGSGFLDVIQSITPDKYMLSEKFPTESGARTSVIVPETGIIYLAVPARSLKSAEIHVYKIL